MRLDQWSSDEIDAMKAKDLPPLEFNRLKQEWHEKTKDEAELNYWKIITGAYLFDD